MCSCSRTNGHTKKFVAKLKESSFLDKIITDTSKAFEEARNEHDIVKATRYYKDTLAKHTAPQGIKDLLKELDELGKKLCTLKCSLDRYRHDQDFSQIQGVKEMRQNLDIIKSIPADIVDKTLEAATTTKQLIQKRRVTTDDPKTAVKYSEEPITQEFLDNFYKQQLLKPRKRAPSFGHDF